MYTVEKTFKVTMPGQREDCWWVMGGVYQTEQRAIEACRYYRNTLFGRVLDSAGRVVYVDDPTKP